MHFKYKSWFVIASEVGTCITFRLQIDLNDENSNIVDIDCHHGKEHKPGFQKKDLEREEIMFTTDEYKRGVETIDLCFRC